MEPATPSLRPSVASILTLQRSRALLRNPFGRSLAISVAFVYGFVSLLVGGMLVFDRTQQTQVTVTILTAGSSNAWWNYPALFVLAPGGVIALPFWPAVTMVLVSIGVGLGMSVGIVLAVRLLRISRRASSPTLASSAAGLTPAMLALVTLGACCSTTAAATAGIGAVAQASGQSLTTVFDNTWYLGLFQMAVLGVALVAQEQLVVLYGSVSRDAPAAALTPGEDRRAVLAALLRVGLLAGGVTWVLAGLIEIAAPPAGSLAGVLALQVLLQHGLAGGTAVVAGLFGSRVLRWLAAPGLPRQALRWALGLSGATMVLGAPPPIAGDGLYGFANELLGAHGVSAGLGGVAPPFGGLALGLRWGFQLLLVGSFSVALAVSPPPVATPELRPIAAAQPTN